MPALAKPSDMLLPSLHRLPLIQQVSPLALADIPADVSIWQVTLAVGAGQQPHTAEMLDQLMDLLHEDERMRCERYRQLPDRIRFAAMHVVLRQLLADRLQQPAEHIRYTCGPFGKPYLDMPATTLQFNISHSGDGGLIALSAQRAVGVDIEAVKPLLGRQPIGNVLSAEEQLYCAQQQHPAAFFTLWTGKEAVLKAMATGIQASLATVSVLPTGHQRFQVSLDGNAADIQAWQLPVRAGYAAALALI
jgi:4'-phosphopantetheinyl transferase